MAVLLNNESSLTLSLLDRVAIVTGASRGIGRAIALHLASLGAKIVVNYSSNATTAQEVVTQINSSVPGDQTRAIAVQANVSNPDQVKSLFDAAEQTFQTQPHILVTSAAILDPKYPPIAETAVEDFDGILAVNARGTFLFGTEIYRILHCKTPSFACAY